jgi:hypothetical protein
LEFWNNKSSGSTKRIVVRVEVASSEIKSDWLDIDFTGVKQSEPTPNQSYLLFSRDSRPVPIVDHRN